MFSDRRPICFKLHAVGRLFARNETTYAFLIVILRAVSIIIGRLEYRVSGISLAEQLESLPGQAAEGVV